MFKQILSALVLSAAAASANATVIDYSMTLNGYAKASGQFTGTDGNADGFLSLDELSALSFDIPIANYHFDLSMVYGFGSYNILENTWIADAPGWNKENIAYLSFGDGSLAVAPDFVTNLVMRPAQAADVPEPASTVLAGLGLLALGAARRRKK